MAEWNITKSVGKCTGTDKEFVPSQEYYGALVETDQGLERRDYCIEFWQQNTPEVYCFWKTTFPDEQEKKKLFVDDDMLMSFFDRLEKETDQEKMDFRFVLTLVLMRKRLLKYQGSRIEDGKEIWELKNMPTKEMVEVINPDLAEDRIEQLREQMGQILHGELT